jgi:hypothetical protein
MLAALAGGRALPATDLARHARIKPAAATAHLHRLIDGGLVRVRVQGRHRYHEIAGPEVAAVLEAATRSPTRARPSSPSSGSTPVRCSGPGVSWPGPAWTGPSAARTWPAPTATPPVAHRLPGRLPLGTTGGGWG